MESKQIDIIKDVFVPENAAECDRLSCDNCYYGYERRDCPAFTDEECVVDPATKIPKSNIEPTTPWPRK